jgi:polyisoprenoid-binding protein YceI
MTRHFAIIAALVTLGAPFMPAASFDGIRTFTVDGSRSRAMIAVGKAGAFSFAAGHTHEVEAPAIAGTVGVSVEEPERSTVRLEIDATKLRVTGKGEPPDDVPKVQEKMLGGEVLDVRRYPTITFDSTHVVVKRRNGASLDLNVEGNLTLHGVTHALVAPVTATVGPTLTANGRFAAKQTDYGMKPVSVGGVVAVKDAVEISFTIVAR